jgi:hypothetical protein
MFMETSHALPDDVADLPEAVAEFWLWIRDTLGVRLAWNKGLFQAKKPLC